MAKTTQADNSPAALRKAIVDRTVDPPAHLVAAIDDALVEVSLEDVPGLVVSLWYNAVALLVGDRECPWQRKAPTARERKDLIKVFKTAYNLRFLIPNLKHLQKVDGRAALLRELDDIVRDAHFELTINPVSEAPPHGPIDTGLHRFFAMVAAALHKAGEPLTVQPTGSFAVISRTLLEAVAEPVPTDLTRWLIKAKTAALQ